MGNLKVGDKAPELNIPDQDGQLVKLSDFAGKKVALYFYPKDNTPGCTAEACNLRDNYSVLKNLGIEILGVSADNEKSHKGFIEKQSLPFRLLSDFEKTVLKAYDAWGEKYMYGKSYDGILRKTFIIDEQGKIEKIIEKVDTKNHASQIIENNTNS